MESVRLIHVSDIHLGRTPHNIRERHEDIFESFRQVLDHALEIKPEAVVIGGDLFDVPRPSLSDVKRAAVMIRDAAGKGVRFIVAHGEHDKPKRREASVLEVLSGLIEGFIAPVMRVGPPAGFKDMVVRLGSLEVYVVHFQHDSPERCSRFLKAQLEAFDRMASASDARWKVLLGHFALTSEAGIEEMCRASVEDLPRVQYAALGHLHRKAVRLDSQPPYAYPGVLDPFEEGDVRLGGGSPLLVEITGDGEVSVEELRIRRRPQVVEYLDLDPSTAARGVYGRVRSAIARAKARVRGGDGLKPLVHLVARVPPTVPSRSVIEASQRAAGELGVLVRVRVVAAGGGGGGGRALPPQVSVSPVEVAVRLFNLSRDEASALFEVLVPALVERDEEAARRVVEELASKRGEAFWRSILEGRRGA